MTSGRKAKQRREQRSTEAGIRDLTAGTPMTRPVHPLGEHADAFIRWRSGMASQLRKIIDENRAALDQCNGLGPDCPSSVHVPGCRPGR